MATSDQAIALYNKLGAGISVDWCRSQPGLHWSRYWLKFGLSLPHIFKHRGFSHVRIVCAYRASEELIEHLGKLVQQCIDVELHPIIAYEAPEFLGEPSPEAAARAVNWWNTMGRALNPYGNHVSFNFIASPVGIETRAKTVNQLYQDISDTLRPLCVNRLHIVGTSHGRPGAPLHKLTLPTTGGDTDPNTIAAVEFYPNGPQIDTWSKGSDAGAHQEEVAPIRAYAEAISAWARSYADGTETPVYVSAWSSGYPQNVIPPTFEFSLHQRKLFSRHIKYALKLNNLRAWALGSDRNYYDRSTNQWDHKQASLLETIFMA